MKIIIKSICYNIKKIFEIIGVGTKAFADIQAGDSVSTSSGKVALVALKRTVYCVTDYWLAAFTAAMNIALKALEIHLLYAFITMWLINILFSGVFLAIYVKTGHDISLGEDLRRASDAIHNKSRVAGHLAMIGVIFQAAIWSGPEQVVIFFRKEIGGIPRMMAVMLLLTAVQTVVWMYIYRTGYDIVI